MPMVGPLGVLFDLAKKQIGNYYYKLGNILGRPFMSPFLAILLSMVIYTRPNL